MSRYLGIDFSGNHLMWRAGCKRSNVWIATVDDGAEGLVLRDVRSGQDLPGDGAPFDRLAALLRGGAFVAAGIDAPCALPADQMPAGGLSALLERVAALPRDGRPFPTAETLVAAFLPGAGPRGEKILRACERAWQRKGVNVRSTLWAGPRGGAAMTAACLTLLAAAERPVWPWAPCLTDGMIVEAFPAGQLWQWWLPHQRYAGDSRTDRVNRESIVRALDERVRLPASARSLLRDSADALDSVLCAVAARAAAQGAVADLPDPPPVEGWISVAPGERERTAPASRVKEGRRLPILEWPGDGPGIIQPPRPRPGKPALPERAVLCFFKDVLDRMVAEGRLEPIRTLPGEGDPVVVHRLVDDGAPEVAVAFPGIGAPFAAAILEELIGLGCRRFVACGGAGVLDGDVPLGRPVVVTKALRDEGTSYHYQRDGRFASPDEALTADLEAACRAAGAPFVEAATWTTDAVYRETPETIARRRAEGCLTVEMEAAAFFAVARFRGVPFAQLLYAGDDVSGETWDHRGWINADGARRALLGLAIAAARRG